MVEPVAQPRLVHAASPYSVASSHAEVIPERGSTPAAEELEAPSWGETVLEGLKRAGWALEGVFFGAIGILLAPITIPGLLLYRSGYSEAREKATDIIADLGTQNIRAFKEFEQATGTPLQDILKKMDDKQLTKLFEEPRFQKILKSLNKEEQEKIVEAFIFPVIKVVVGVIMAAPLLHAAELFSQVVHGAPPVKEELQKEMRDFIREAYDIKRSDNLERSYLEDSLGQGRLSLLLDPSSSAENTELTRILYQDYSDVPRKKMLEDLDFAIATIKKGMTQQVTWSQPHGLSEKLHDSEVHLLELKVKLLKTKRG